MRDDSRILCKRIFARLNQILPPDFDPAEQTILNRRLLNTRLRVLKQIAAEIGA